jgi:acyl-CoA reductase-like NAD-dependent aldehyde dehydrogenase
VTHARAVAPPESPTVARRPVESRDPYTGDVWARYSSADADAVRAAVAAARGAQPAWAALPVRARARILEQFRRQLCARRA